MTHIESEVNFFPDGIDRLDPSLINNNIHKNIPEPFDTEHLWGRKKVQSNTARVMRIIDSEDDEEKRSKALSYIINNLSPREIAELENGVNMVLNERFRSAQTDQKLDEGLARAILAPINLLTTILNTGKSINDTVKHPVKALKNQAQVVVDKIIGRDISFNAEDGDYDVDPDELAQVFNLSKEQAKNFAAVVRENLQGVRNAKEANLLIKQLAANTFNSEI